MKRIGIIGAMEVEVDFLRGLMGSGAKRTEAGSAVFEEGSIGCAPVVLVRSGIGKVNAALCAQRLILQFGCTHIVNTGIAGAMAKELGALDFVVSTDAVQHDVDATGFGYRPGQIPQMDTFSFAADRRMARAALEAFGEDELSAGHKMIEGRIATGDQFISDRETKARIQAAFAPACVEMEGCAIAQACHLNGTPFVIIRCMSDNADDLKENDYAFNEAAAGELSARIVRRMIPRI